MSMVTEKARKVLTEFVREHGPDSDFELAREHVLRGTGVTTQRRRFDSVMRQEFPRTEPASELQRQQQPPATGTSTDMADIPWGQMSEFLRFAAHVEAAGGVRMARRYLDMMDTLGRSLAAE